MGYNFANTLPGDSILASYKEGSMIKMKVRIMDCLFHKPDTGFGIYSVETESLRRFKIVGVFVISISVNRYYEVTGVVTKRAGEWQLEVKDCQSTFPDEQEGILTVLRTLHGLNTQANIVYRYLGKNSLQLIHDNPEEVVRRIPGVSLKRARIWQDQLSCEDETEHSLAVLKSMGINMAKAKRLIDEFGTNVGDQIQNDPYFLMSKAGFLSFSECDRVALASGMGLSNPMRVAAASCQLLKQEALQSGNCCLSELDFIDRLRQLTGLHLNYRDAQALVKQARGDVHRWSQYGVNCEVSLPELRKAMQVWQQKKKRDPFKFYVYIVPDEALEKGIQMALAQKTIVKDEVDGSTVYMQNAIYQAEEEVAAAIRNIQNADMPFFNGNPEVISDYCKKNGISLEEKQLEAVDSFTRTRGGFHVLYGPAGCGKTFTLNVILGVLGIKHQQNHGSLTALILAPTGKAAKVASEATGLPAFTIHKALGLIGDEEQPFHFTQINANCVVIDEFSMVDIHLAKKLLSSIPPMTKVIIMGDSNQLPSIGPGTVLKDIISSGSANAVALNVVKRQAALSGILLNANKILRGESIQSAPDPNGKTGAFLFPAESPIQCRDLMVNAYVNEIRKGHSISEVQILCPQKMTEVGTDVLNYMIQQKLFPPKDIENDVPAKNITFDQDGTMETAVLYFRAGDKVIHVENNYNITWYRPSSNGQLVPNVGKKGIINGEMGTVCRTRVIRKDGTDPYGQVLVKYDDGYVLYQNELLNQLQHAYALTIHKAQGSQWPIVIAPIMMCNYRMLARNLFYTLYTRAQHTSIIYGQPAAIQRAIDNDSLSARKTTLAYRL